MLEIFLKTLPFFAIIGLGYWAGRTQFFQRRGHGLSDEIRLLLRALGHVVPLFGQSELGGALGLALRTAYLVATITVYLMVFAVALARKILLAAAGIESHCGVISNVGFLGLPMLALLMGEAAIGPIMLVLTVDLIFLGSVVVIIINGSKKKGDVKVASKKSHAATRPM